MKLNFRDACEGDRVTLEAINRAVYEGVVVAQFGRWDDAFEAGIFANKWAEQRFSIVSRDGTDVAAIWVESLADHLWLREIQVYPVHQGRTVGTWLIKQVQRDAKRKGVPVRLRVLKLNRAIGLYQRLGFEFFGEHTDTHYWMQWTDPAGVGVESGLESTTGRKPEG